MALLTMLLFSVFNICSGIALHPTETCLATASGQRHFGSYDDDS